MLWLLFLTPLGLAVAWGVCGWWLVDVQDVAAAGL